MISLIAVSIYNYESTYLPILAVQDEVGHHFDHSHEYWRELRNGHHVAITTRCLRLFALVSQGIPQSDPSLLDYKPSPSLRLLGPRLL